MISLKNIILKYIDLPWKYTINQSFKYDLNENVQILIVFSNFNRNVQILFIFLG